MNILPIKRRKEFFSMKKTFPVKISSKAVFNQEIMVKFVGEMFNGIASLFCHSKKTKSPNKRDGVNCLRPIYYFSRILGLLSFSIIRDMNGEIQNIRVHLFDLLWFMVSICVFLILIIMACISVDLPQKTNSTRLLIFGQRVHSILVLINAAIMIIMDMCNRFRILNIVQKFTTFDKEVSTFLKQSNLIH